MCVILSIFLNIFLFADELEDKYGRVDLFKSKRAIKSTLGWTLILEIFTAWLRRLFRRK